VKKFLTLYGLKWPWDR